MNYKQKNQILIYSIELIDKYKNCLNAVVEFNQQIEKNT